MFKIQLKIKQNNYYPQANPTITTLVGTWFNSRVHFGQYLSIVGDGLFVLLDNVLRTQAVLCSSNLSAGVRTNAVGCEGSYSQNRTA